MLSRTLLLCHLNLGKFNLIASFNISFKKSFIKSNKKSSKNITNIFHDMKFATELKEQSEGTPKIDGPV
jgi:hypothetical protein